MTNVVRIETERLVLREQLDGDAEEYGPLQADPEYRRFLPVRRSQETPIERARRGMGNLMARWEREPLTSVGWVIARREDGRVIGMGGIDEAEVPEDGEIDYRFGRPYWGQGYGREAAHAIARFAVENMPFERIVAYIVRGNIGSIRIAEGLGLRFEREVDYLQFFPDPSLIELADPMTRMYAAPRDEVTLGDGPYRAIEDRPVG